MSFTFCCFILSSVISLRVPIISVGLPFLSRCNTESSAVKLRNSLSSRLSLARMLSVILFSSPLVILSIAFFKRSKSSGLVCLKYSTDGSVVSGCPFLPNAVTVLLATWYIHILTLLVFRMSANRLLLLVISLVIFLSRMR